MKARPTLLMVLLAAFGCGNDGQDARAAPSQPHPPANYPLADEAYTTLQALWAPLLPSADVQAAIDDGSISPFDHDAFDDLGLGVTLAAGQPWVEQLELAPDFPTAAGGERRSLLYLWHAADPQVIDEESPIRFEAFAELYRPHGHMTVQVFEANVRSAQRISDLSSRPFDFAVIAGDLTDGSQLNELRWTLTALNGGDIDPDSGVDDDPVPGAGNDYNDPFTSEGLLAPWYAVIGNHETLYNGGFSALNDELRAAAVGSEIYDFFLFDNGFRDGSTPDAAVVTEGTTAADPDRIPLNLHEVLEELHAAGGLPAGHGLQSADVDADIGYFSVQPVEGKPIRLICLNTVNSSPTTVGIGSLGHMNQAQLEWLQAQLIDADAAGELVLVMSHHRVADFHEGSEVSGEELAAVLEASEGVVLHITGHGHRNTKGVHPEVATGVDTHGYWELMLASTLDFPMQTRVIEIVDEGNGYLSIYCTNLEHNSALDSIAHRGRQLAAGARAFPGVTGPSDLETFWTDDVPAQNLLLRIPIPDTVRDTLAAHQWPTVIESEETLAKLSQP